MSGMNSFCTPGPQRLFFSPRDAFAQKRAQASLALVFSLIALALILPVGLLSLKAPLALVTVLGCVILALSLFSVESALVIILFSMVFSPELQFGSFGERSIMLRVEDILLLVVFFGWFARSALNKELGLIRSTPLNQPIFFYILACLLATLMELLFGKGQPLRSLFYLLKYFEYFFLFFMAANVLRSRGKARRFIILIFLAGLILAAYGWFQIPSGERVTTPFEGKSSEPNTFGGYLVLMMGIVLGFIVHSRRHRAQFIGFFAFLFVPFLFTLSRGSWVAFLPMLGVTLLYTKRLRLQLIAVFTLLAFVIVMAPFLTPNLVKKRVNETFSEGKQYTVMGKRITLDYSTAERIDSWVSAFRKVQARPLLGYGIPATAVIDNQYSRVLVETGFLGMAAFAWLLLSIFVTTLRIYRKSSDSLTQALSLGFLAGFAGLLLHGFSAATFIIIRIMEPFWFLCALVIRLPELAPDDSVAP